MLSRLVKLFAFLFFSQSYLLPTAHAYTGLCPGVIDNPAFYSSQFKLSYNSTLVPSTEAYSNRYIEGEGTHGFDVNAKQRFYISYRGQKLLDDGAEEYVAAQADFGYRQLFCINSNLSFALSGFYGAPVDDEAYKYDNSKGQLSSRLGITWDEGAEGFIVSLGSTQRRHLYEYTDSEGGGLLKQWSVEPSFSIGYRNPTWQFSAAFINFMGWDFEGEQFRSQYYHKETITYTLTDEWSVFAFHNNDGNTASYGGSGSNVYLYTEDRSQVGLGMTYKP